MKSLASAWAEFEREILDPRNAGPHQRKEIRRAFYTGAGQLLLMLTNATDDGASTSTTESASYIESIAVELEQFATDLAEGRV